MYKRTLDMDPSDLDAKINLEYVQSLLEQQQNQQSQSDQDQQQDQQRDKRPGEEGQSQQGEDRPPEQDQQKQDNQDGGQQERDAQQQAGEPDQDRPEDQQAPQDVPREEGELTVEEAERILEALKDRELQAQKRRRILLRGRNYRGNEW